MKFRRFQLQRSEDFSGVSGTGFVAEGIEFTDGTAVIRWVAGELRSTAIYPDIKTLEEIHGHGGATIVVWMD